MTQNGTTTTAAQFETFDEQTQGDLKHDAWSRAVEQFREEHPDWYDHLESSSKVSWDDMELEIYEDENGRKYFHIVVGVTGGPGEPAKKRKNLAVEFMDSYRNRLGELVQEHKE